MKVCHAVVLYNIYPRFTYTHTGLTVMVKGMWTGDPPSLSPTPLSLPHPLSQALSKPLRRPIAALPLESREIRPEGDFLLKLYSVTQKILNVVDHMVFLHLVYDRLLLCRLKILEQTFYIFSGASFVWSWPTLDLMLKHPS